ncbi:methyltransferase domain-containing protein [Leptospira sp. WS92.C1]
MSEKSINFDLVSDIYDVYVSSKLDIDFFLEETETINSPILELMAGTGRVTIPLLEKKRRMFCVDYSSGMLTELKRKTNSYQNAIEILEADVRFLKLDTKFECILLPFHSLSEILDPKDQEDVLISIYNLLADKGKFILTLQNPKIRLKDADGLIRVMGEFTLSNSRKLVVSYYNEYKKKQGIATGMQFYEFYNPKNVLLEKRYMPIRFRPIFKEEIDTFLDRIGFTILELYGGYDRSKFIPDQSPFMIFILGK